LKNGKKEETFMGSEFGGLESKQKIEGINQDKIGRRKGRRRRRGRGNKTRCVE
jgi:hypothetical protein